MKPKSKNKNKYQDDETDFDIDDEEDDSNIDDDYSLEEETQISEKVENRLSAKDFDTERLLYDIAKTLNGLQKRNGKWIRVSYPLCRSEFINNYINSIRGLVNFHNMFSVTTAQESAFNMLESLKEITYYAVDSGVKEEHIETLVNIYDTIKATFYGIIIDGRGTENVKQALISAYKDIRDIQTAKTSNSPLNMDYIKDVVFAK